LRSTGETTIIIVTFRRWAATQRCIDSVLRHTEPRPKLLIVDNGSPEVMRQDLLNYPGRKLFFESNVGFYVALNTAMRLVDDDLVSILDSDIVVSDGWLASLCSEVLSSSDIGLAGSRYLNSTGTLQEGYPALRSDGWYGENSRDVLHSADCQYIAIGCSVMRRSSWQCVGGFDERYFISHGDIDFCYKLRYEGGYRVRYCPQSSVVHDHGFGREEEYERIRFDSNICDRDFALFRAKWQDRYSREISGTEVMH